MRIKHCIILLLAASCGCSAPRSSTDVELTANEVFKDTISDYCELTGYAPIRVLGYSLVLGLPGTGSSECDSVRKKYITNHLLVLKSKNQLVQFYQKLSAEDIIADASTTVVIVNGIIPAGAPKGTSFDVKVTPLPYTQATSLQGGYLMPTDLHIVVSGQDPGKLLAGRTVAYAAGPIFVNPFPTSPADPTTYNPRLGSILGGGRSRYDRQINLALLDPDYRIAQQLQKRINTRFQLPNTSKVADASRTKISLTIPGHYRDRYQHFISLVMNLYLRDDPGYLDTRLNQLDRLAQQDNADLEAIALAWEAIGKNSLYTLTGHYQKLAGGPAFYAARTALNLGDRKAIDTLIAIADSPDHPFRAQAIQALGTVADDFQAHSMLAKLIHHSNNRLRLLAYDSLRGVGDDQITSTTLPAGFDLDRVDSSGPPLVCVWATTTPRIVLFGRNLAVQANLFYESSDKAITLNAAPDAKHLTIIRQMPNIDHFFSIETSFQVADLIESLARPPLPDKNGTIQGAGLSFSQIVGILYPLCQQNNIETPFFLHHIEEDLMGR